jgi:DUF4097 and DUF4098 domain-containing protein YvlB
MRMSMSRLVPALIVSSVLVPALLVGAPPASAAETTRTLRLVLPADTGPFEVENLAGTMTVVPGTGPAIVAVATVHAESQELADAVRFEKVTAESGLPALRVRYPLDRHGSLRYPQGHVENAFFRLLSTGSSTTTEYDGHQVRISDSGGVLLYADLEVQLPRHVVEGTFRNHVGAMRGRELEGRLTFDSSSGDVTLEKVRGEVRVDTASGDVKATDLQGSFVCVTGSGDCRVTGFRGDRIQSELGSGDVTIRSARARLVSTHTGSGDVRLLEADIEQLDADTGSGNVELQALAGRLVRVKADTGSGDVTLRLGPDASFEALADQGSGDLTVRYADAQPIVRRREVIGYRRGDARIRIDVDTGSGDLVIEPGT